MNYVDLVIEALVGTHGLSYRQATDLVGSCSASVVYSARWEKNVDDVAAYLYAVWRR